MQSLLSKHSLSEQYDDDIVATLSTTTIGDRKQTLLGIKERTQNVTSTSLFLPEKDSMFKLCQYVVRDSIQILKFWLIYTKKRFLMNRSDVSRLCKHGVGY